MIPHTHNYVRYVSESSYELDDAPDYERFYFISSGSELNVNLVLDAAKKLVAKKEKVIGEKIEIPDPDKSIKQISVLIKKLK